MRVFPRIVVNGLLVPALCVAPLLGQGARTASTVRQVKVLGSKDAVEIEIEASDHLTPQTQVLTGPDRLVIDFPNAVPGSQLRSQSINRGEVKDVRFGLFQSNPPVTRLVLDLKTAQSYQVFPNGRTILIKVTGASAPDTSAGVENFPEPSGRSNLVVANFKTGAERIQVNPAAGPKLEVSFHDGLLAIRSNRATLSEVLFAVQQRTGAQIGLVPGAEQEKVVANFGPGPAQEVLAHLLNGSKFNFLILNSVKDPRQLDRLILSPRAEGAMVAVAPAQAADDSDGAEPVQATAVQPAPVQTVPPQAQPSPAPGFPVPGARTQPEANPPTEDDTPD